jgi:hypothetical protein
MSPALANALSRLESAVAAFNGSEAKARFPTQPPVRVTPNDLRQVKPPELIPQAPSNPTVSAEPAGPKPEASEVGTPTLSPTTLGRDTGAAVVPQSDEASVVRVPRRAETLPVAFKTGLFATLRRTFLGFLGR